MIEITPDEAAVLARARTDQRLNRNYSFVKANGLQLIYAMQKEGLVCEWFSARENTIVYAATELGRAALEAFEAKTP